MSIDDDFAHTKAHYTHCWLKMSSSSNQTLLICVRADSRQTCFVLENTQFTFGVPRRAAAAARQRTLSASSTPFEKSAFASVHPYRSQRTKAEIPLIIDSGSAAGPNRL